MNKKVLFDVDNTILSFDKAEEHGLIKTFAELGIEMPDGLIRTYNSVNIKYWEKLERGEITRDEVALGRFSETFSIFGIDCPAETVNSIYCSHLAEGHWFMPGALEMLEEIYGEYDLYLVSNGTKSIQESRLNSAGIRHFFKGIYISEDLGYEKPTLDFFNNCDLGSDLDKKHCIIIGDSLTSDMKGGNNFGIKTCWYNPEAKPLPEGNTVRIDYMIDNLNLVGSILEKAI